MRLGWVVGAVVVLLAGACSHGGPGGRTRSAADAGGPRAVGPAVTTTAVPKKGPGGKGTTTPSSGPAPGPAAAVGRPSASTGRYRYIVRQDGQDRGVAALDVTRSAGDETRTLAVDDDKPLVVTEWLQRTEAGLVVTRTRWVSGPD